MLDSKVLKFGLILMVLKVEMSLKKRLLAQLIIVK